MGNKFGHYNDQAKVIIFLAVVALSNFVNQQGKIYLTKMKNIIANDKANIMEKSYLA